MTEADALNVAFATAPVKLVGLWLAPWSSGSLKAYASVCIGGITFHAVSVHRHTGKPWIMLTGRPMLSSRVKTGELTVARDAAGKVRYQAVITLEPELMMSFQTATLAAINAAHPDFFNGR